jgi:hypothetical protein
MAGDSSYQGGGNVVLTNFYNNLRQDEFRRQQQSALEGQANAKQRDATAKQLEGLTAKLSTKGVRDIDVPYFAKKYDEIRSLKAKINAEQDPVVRAQDYVDYERATYTYGVEADQSIGEKSSQLKFKESVEKSPWAYSQGVRENFDKRLTTSTFDLNRWDDNDWKAQGDTNKVLNKIRARIKGVVDSQRAAIQRINTTSGNQSGVDVFTIKKIGKEEGVNLILQDLKSDPETGYTFRQQFPSLKDEEIALSLYEQLVPESAFTREDYKGFDANARPTSSGASATDIRSKEELDIREKSLKDIVLNKDVKTLEVVKASLPTNATAEYIISDKSKAKIDRATGKPIASKEDVTGLRITIPAGYDQYGNYFGTIDQIIDFTTGDAIKNLNNVFNKFVGKKITNEDLQKRGVGGNATKPKASTAAKPSKAFDPEAYYKN